MKRRSVFASARILPGKASGRSPTLARSRTSFNGSSFSSPLRAKVCHDFRDRLIDDLVITFAGNAADDVSRRIDQHLRGPGTHAVALPDRIFRVVVNGMLDLVAQDDAPDVFRLLFVLKLCGVNADHDQFIRVFRFELLQIGNDVDAVDAAVSPEVEQNDFAF